MILELDQRPGFQEGTIMPDANILSHTPAIVLCGGLGTRMKDITGDKLAKPLTLVTPSRTLLDAPVAQLQIYGVTPIIFATTDGVIDQLQAHHRRNWDRKSRFLYSVEDEPEGAIPAVLQALEQYNLHDRHVIVSHGDEFTYHVDLPAMMNQHKATHAGATLVVTSHPEGGSNYVGWTDHTRKVTQVKRNPSPQEMDGGFTMTGLFIFSPGMFGELTNGHSSWERMVVTAQQRNQLYAFETNQPFVNANEPKDLQRARVLFTHLPLAR